MKVPSKATTATTNRRTLSLMRTTMEPSSERNDHEGDGGSSRSMQEGDGSFNDRSWQRQPIFSSATSTTTTTVSKTVASFSPLARRLASSTRLKMSASGEAVIPATATASKAIPEVHPESPYLYKVPSDLHRYYRPLPLLVQTISIMLATWLAALTTWAKLTWWQPLSIMRGGKFQWSRVALFLVKAILYSLLSQAVLQEIFARPSRVSIDTLLKQYFLPSKLSQYQKIAVPSNEKETEPFSLGVHYLQYDNPQVAKDNIVSETPKFGALYLQHGFGASSLSWLPVIPSLARRMGARVAVGHDAVGFGFTERPKDTVWYTSKQSARIAQQILEKNSKSASSDENSTEAVALMGHSMGSLSMLRLATQLPKETPKFVILSSPALGLNNRKPPPSKSSTMTKIRRKTLNPVGRAAQQALFFPVTKYILRRAIGTKGSWRLGLKAAWGDSSKVTDGDVLRFSWPAIGLGWEKGILKFASAQSLPQEDDLDNDQVLMKEVLKLPNTKVAIILGSKDRIVTQKLVRKFMQAADPEQKVPIIELEGLGHDAFEEDEKTFCDTVDHLLQTHWQCESH